MRIALALLLVTGCMREAMHVRPSALLEHPLTAIPPEEGDTASIDPDREIEVAIPGDPHTIPGKKCTSILGVRACIRDDHEEQDATTLRRMTIRERVGGCRDTAN